MKEILFMSNENTTGQFVRIAQKYKKPMKSLYKCPAFIFNKAQTSKYSIARIRHSNTTTITNKVEADDFR